MNLDRMLILCVCVCVCVSVRSNSQWLIVPHAHHCSVCICACGPGFSCRPLRFPMVHAMLMSEVPQCNKAILSQTLCTLYVLFHKASNP